MEPKGDVPDWRTVYVPGVAGDGACAWFVGGPDGDAAVVGEDEGEVAPPPELPRDLALPPVDVDEPRGVVVDVSPARAPRLVVPVVDGCPPVIELRCPLGLAEWPTAAPVPAVAAFVAPDRS
jgi:hypothetical protein